MLDAQKQSVGICGTGPDMTGKVSFTLTCSVALSGRYVEVFIPRNVFLTLCEVEISGTEEYGEF